MEAKLGLRPEPEVEGIVSKPPDGKKKVESIYWDQNTQECVIETES